MRVALGALYIQQYKVLSDRETVEDITENPYIQYFLGLPEFQETAPFDPSMMTHFRKRLGSEIINQVNEWIITEETEQANQDDNDSDDDDDNFPKGGKPPSKQTDTDSKSKQPENKGKLIMDATCAPADIAYPTDLGLLNEAREKFEHIIDVLYEPYRGKRKKPRTYRQKARKDYLSIAKQRKPIGRTIRKAVRKQLDYVARDLRII